MCTCLLFDSSAASLFGVIRSVGDVFMAARTVFIWEGIKAVYVEAASARYSGPSRMIVRCAGCAGGGKTTSVEQAAFTLRAAAAPDASEWAGNHFPTRVLIVRGINKGGFSNSSFFSLFTSLLCFCLSQPRTIAQGGWTMHFTPVLAAAGGLPLGAKQQTPGNWSAEDPGEMRWQSASVEGGKLPWLTGRSILHD